MKFLKVKSILLSLIVSIQVTVFLSSCEQEVIKPFEEVKEEVENTSINSSQNFKVDVKNEMLAFPTREDYDLAIDYLGKMNSEQFADWETQVGFISLRSTTTSEEREDIGIHDDLLATFLNPNSLIEIEGNIFEIDIIAESVSVTPVNSFYKKSLNETQTKVYSIDDNVLDIIDGTDIPIANSKKGKFCDKDKVGSYFHYFSNGRVKYKIVYQKSGILNSLVANLKKESLRGGAQYGGNIELSLQTTGNNYWTNKKKGPRNFSYSDSGGRREYDCRPYYRSRRLKAYRFEMAFFAEDLGSTSPHLDERWSIQCNHNEITVTPSTSPNYGEYIPEEHEDIKPPRSLCWPPCPPDELCIGKSCIPI